MLGLGLGIAAVAGSPSDRDRDGDYRRTIERINRRTKARQITVEELRGRMAKGEKLVVLDIREPRENAVSALPSARLVPPDDVDSTALDVPADALVVTYCTVGYRSGYAAVALEKRLGHPVFNLDGGIIAWFNDGGEVVDPQGKPTDRIDTYDDDWAKYVTRPRAAPP